MRSVIGELEDTRFFNKHRVLRLICIYDHAALRTFLQKQSAICVKRLFKVNLLIVFDVIDLLLFAIVVYFELKLLEKSLLKTLMVFVLIDLAWRSGYTDHKDLIVVDGLVK